MFAVIGFVYALRLLMFQSVSGTITGCTQRVTSSDRLGAVVETACHQGDWPTEDSTAIDLRTRELSLHEILLPRQYEEATSVPPLPFLPRLTHLHFDHIVSSFSNQSFPLQTVTRLLDRSKLLQLVLQRLRVPVVDATFFTGFTGLETLKFHDCEIYDFHPNAFGAFISCLPERLPPDSRLLNKKGSCSSSLTFLVMAGLKMQTFSWDVLAPISASLESIKLGYNQELTEITMSPPAAAAASIQPRRLQRLWIYSNINLRSIPAAVIKTVRPSGPATSRGLGPPQFVIFQWNGNPCGGCALRPLVAWARQAALIGAPHLDLTCLVSPECGFKTISNRMTSWRDYVEPSCADDESVAIPDCGIVRSDDVFALHGYSAPKLLPGDKVIPI